MAKIFLLFGAAYGFLGVALGAFAAHGLKAKVSPADLEVFKTAASYQLVHSGILFLVGWVLKGYPSKTLAASGAFFALGVLVFSGSLYLLVFLQARWLGAVTPIGGVCLLVGWASLFFAALKLP